jgi:hypothetical protein
MYCTKITELNRGYGELAVKPAQLASANFKLLSTLGIVMESEQSSPYNVLIEPINEFTIYLPPTVIE